MSIDDYLNKKASSDLSDSIRSADPIIAGPTIGLVSKLVRPQQDKPWVPVTAGMVTAPKGYRPYLTITPEMLDNPYVRAQLGIAPDFTKGNIKYFISQPGGIEKLHILLSPFNPRISYEDKQAAFKHLKLELWNSLSDKQKQQFEIVYGKPFEKLTVNDLQYVLYDMQEKGTLPELFKDIEPEKVDLAKYSITDNRFDSGAYSNDQYGVDPIHSTAFMSNQPQKTDGYTFVDLGDGYLGLYDINKQELMRGGLPMRALEIPGLFGPALHKKHLLRSDDIWGSRVNGTHEYNSSNWFMSNTPFWDPNKSQHMPGFYPYRFKALKDEKGNIITNPVAYYEEATMQRLLCAAKVLGTDGLLRLVKDQYGYIPSSQADDIRKLSTIDDEAKDSNYITPKYLEAKQKEREQYALALEQRNDLSPVEKEAYLWGYDRLQFISRPKGDATQLQVVGEGRYINSDGKSETNKPCCYVVRDIDGGLKVYVPPHARRCMAELKQAGDIHSLQVLRNAEISIESTKEDVLLYEALTTQPEKRTPMQVYVIQQTCAKHPDKVLDIMTENHMNSTNVQPGQDPAIAREQFRSQYYGNTLNKDNTLQVNPQAVYNAASTQAFDDNQYFGIYNYSPYSGSSAYDRNKKDLTSYYKHKEDYYAFQQAAASAQMTDAQFWQHPFNLEIGSYKNYRGSDYNPGELLTGVDKAAQNTPTLSLAYLASLTNSTLNMGNASSYNVMGSYNTKDSNWGYKTLGSIVNGIQSAADQIATATTDVYDEGASRFRVYNPNVYDMYNLANFGNLEGSHDVNRIYKYTAGTIDLLSTVYALQGGAAYASARAAGAPIWQSALYTLTGLAPRSISPLVAPRLTEVAPLIPAAPYGTGFLNKLAPFGTIGMGTMNAYAIKDGDVGFLFGPTKGPALYTTTVNAGSDLAMQFGAFKPYGDQQQILQDTLPITLKDLNASYTTMGNNPYMPYLQETDDKDIYKVPDYYTTYEDGAPEVGTQDKPFPWQQLLLGAGLAAGGLGLYNLMKDKNKKKKKKKKNVYDHYENIQNSYDQY